MHISIPTYNGLSSELWFSSMDIRWTQQICVFKPLKWVLLGHLSNLQSLCFKVHESWISKNPDRAVSELLNNHPDSSIRCEVRCNTVFLSKAHYEVLLNVSHDHTNMLLLGHNVRKGSVTTRSNNLALSAVSICCCVHIEDKWFDELGNTD